jgi:hypothetical protein
LLALAIAIAAIGPPMVAAAHSLDEYLRATYVTLGREGVSLELACRPACWLRPT